MVTQYRAGDRLREEKAGSGTRSAALLAFQADALEHISDAVVVIDPRQEVVYFGPGAERLYGISAPDAIGRPLQSCYQSIWDTPQAEAAAIAALSQEGRWRGENTHILRNGERRRVESTVTLMRDVAGKQCGMLTVIRDISKRWRLEQLLRESEERYRELFERLAVEHAALARLHKLSARLASQDELQTLLDAVLDAAMDLTGAPRGTLQVYDSATESLHIVCSRGFERDFLDFFAIVERQNGSFGRAMSFSGERVIVEDVRKSPLFMGTQAASVLEAAQVRAVQSTPLLGRDGNLLGIISTQWAEPHHPDDSAFRMFDLLAREAADLIEHRQREQGLRESGRRKDEFLAILSHELRNPLSAISTGVSLVERVPPGSDQAKRALRVIERQARQMGRLIDDLLDLTRISRGKIRLQQQSIELNHLLRRTADDHWALFEENGVRLELSLSHQPVYVNGDEVRLAQVVENLLHNCSKFTPRGGWARLSLEVDGADAIIRVCDNGLGISPETLPKVFEPFVQAETTLDRSKGGLGLGLALVKGLVEIHNGTVTAASRGAGSGAEITIRLPLDAAQASPARASKRAAGDRPRRVLIIEDNVDVATTLRDLLETLGHEIAMAHNGPDGIVVAKDFRPDVVLCDIGLPGMDGYQVARILRADKVLERIQLVALSGYALPSDLKLAADAGFDCHLPKPPSLERLEELLIRPMG